MKLDQDSVVCIVFVSGIALVVGSPPLAVLLALPLQILAAVAMDTWMWPWIWRE